MRVRAFVAVGETSRDLTPRLDNTEVTASSPVSPTYEALLLAVRRAAPRRRKEAPASAQEYRSTRSSTTVSTTRPAPSASMRTTVARRANDPAAPGRATPT